tara:strand:- start:406 stop:522 length:117 start_codon:yes stop_codon:yes gene_type:complete
MEIEIIVALVGIVILSSISAYMLISVSKEVADDNWVKR